MIPAGLRAFCLAGFVAATVATAGPLDRLSETQFGLRPELHQPIDADNLDRALLAKAIFHESNQVRRELNLPRFKPSRHADEAAEMQASFSAFRGRSGHDNPMPGQARPFDRIERTGLRVALVAENVASSPILQPLSPDGSYGAVVRGGRRIFVDPASGAELAPHTYASFARRVVADWMASPGHRANLVNPELTLLGCAVWPARSTTGADILISVQVFATPSVRLAQ